MTEVKLESLRDLRGRVPAASIAGMEGSYLVFWGSPSARVEDRVAVLHQIRPNGLPVCQYATGAELITLPGGMRPDVRWYKACRVCARSN